MVSNKKVKMVRAVETKHNMDQKATHPRANCLADSEKKVCEGRGQVEETLEGRVVGRGADGLDWTLATMGSSIATQLLPVASLSGYLCK